MLFGHQLCIRGVGSREKEDVKKYLPSLACERAGAPHRTAVALKQGRTHQKYRIGKVCRSETDVWLEQMAVK